MAIPHFFSPDPLPPRYRLVILDFDGTLADSGDWFLSIAGHLADRFNFRRVDDEDEIAMLRGMSSREVIAYLGIARWKLPRMARYIRRMLAEQIDRIGLFEGVTAMVEALVQAGVQIAIVTSNAEVIARAVLGPVLAGQVSWFECGVSLFGKAPRFKRVIRMSQIAPEHILAIGDETRDIAAARKVGVDAAAVMWGYANREVLLSRSPDMVFESPDDVLQTVLGVPA